MHKVSEKTHLDQLECLMTTLLHAQELLQMFRECKHNVAKARTLSMQYLHSII